MTLDATLGNSSPEKSAQAAREPWIPPRIRKDWAQLKFDADAVSGVITEAMGIKLASVFQPIITPQGEIIAEEALLRARSQGIQIAPLSVFRIAAAHGQLVAFDRLVRTLHLINYLAYPRTHGQLFLNIHPRLPAEVSQHGVVFEEILSSVHWTPKQVTLEFVLDEVGLSDFSILNSAIRNYRERGYDISIDDFLPESQLAHLQLLRPDVVKLDWRQLGREGISSKGRKRLKQWVAQLHDLGARVVMEAIETHDQHEISLAAEVDGLQGFYYAEPKPIASQESGSLLLQDAINKSVHA